jgi:tetratricopeptide (TPR) repeat protein
MKCKLRLLFLVAGAAVLCNSVFAQTVDQGRKFYYYKRFKSAKDVFDKVLAANPNNIDAIYWDGQTLLAMKDSVGARDLYSKALQTNGNAPMLLAGMGGVELRFGKAQDARSHFDMALQLDKGKDIPVFNAVAENNIEASQGDMAYALDKLNAATNVKKFNDADTYVLMGDAYRRQIDGGNAVQAYQKALTIDPKLAEAQFQIGKIYLTQNNADYFLPAFQKAVEMDPAYAPAYFELFYYYFYHWNADNIPKATDALNKYVANSDPGPNVDILQTDFLIVTGKFADAKAKAQAIIAATGDKVDPLFYAKVAYCCDTLGDAACAQQNIATYFAKQVPTAVKPLDYVLRASIESKSPDSVTREKAFDDYGLAIQTDTLAENKAKYLGQAQDLANKLGDKKALAAIARIVYTGLKNPSNSDLFKFGMAYYQSAEYKTADSIFCGIYEQKYPDEVYGYLYCMRVKALEDDSVGSQGLALDAEMKLADFGRAKDSIAKAAGTKDSILYKKYVIDCYSRLAFFYNNTKKDKQQAIFWLSKILEVDPANPDAQRYIDLLKKPPRPAAPAAAKPKTGR